MSINKADFNTARGGRMESVPLPSQPPFEFQGVHACVYPLRANIARLNYFIDQYLNLNVPETIVRFKPSMPFVYLMTMNYGRMAVTARNMGWVSQNEVAFVVPLERYRRVGDELRFEGFAAVSPFIYVDDDISMLTGREVYGWPKIKAWMTEHHDPAAHDIHAPHQLLSLSTKVFPRMYAGERQVPRVLLEVERLPSLQFSQIPAQTETVVWPMTMMQRALQSTVTVATSMMDMATALPARGYGAARSQEEWSRMLERMLGGVDQWLPSTVAQLIGNGRVSSSKPFASEQITLKQFRDAEFPESASYQALVTSPMIVRRFNQGGLMGDIHLMQGDVSAGHRVHIHTYPGHPIVEQLGLEVTDSVSLEGRERKTLHPMMPFWTDVDLTYGAGQIIGERVAMDVPHVLSSWTAGDADPQPPETDERTPFNTALAGATQSIAGPLHFPDVTLQVYPLMARKAHLERFCDSYVNNVIRDNLKSGSGHIEMKPFGHYVYMVVQTLGDQYGRMWSETNDIGCWSDHEVAFYVPVRWYVDGEMMSVGLLNPYVFADSTRAVSTDRMTTGRPTLLANIEAPADVWLSPSGPDAARKFVTVESELLPALFLGQEAERRKVIEVTGEDALDEEDHQGWRKLMGEWGDKLASELKSKARRDQVFCAQADQAQALALELAAFENPINILSLKQYRDVADPSRSCLQAVVCEEKVIERIYSLEPINERVHVLIANNPGLPIAETLGLVSKAVSSRGEDVRQVFQPINPFWMRVAMKDTGAKTVAHRNHEGNWILDRAYGSAGESHESMKQTYYLRRHKATRVGTSMMSRENAIKLENPYRRWIKEERASPEDDSWTEVRGLKVGAGEWLRMVLEGELADYVSHLRTIAHESLDGIDQGIVNSIRAGDAKEMQRAIDAEKWHVIAEALDSDSVLTLAASMQLDELLSLVRSLSVFRAELSEESKAHERLASCDAMRALEELDEPQIVIERILRAGWGSQRNDNDGWSEGFRVRADSVGNRALHAKLVEAYEERFKLNLNGEHWYWGGTPTERS